MPTPHALIVEDELLVAMHLQDLLMAHGYGSYAFAAAAMQAVEQARLRRPDLITMDVGLIHGDGLEAARALREICPGVPMLYVTGSPEVVRDEPGAVVLEKPITARDLRLALKEVKTPLSGEGYRQASSPSVI